MSTPSVYPTNWDKPKASIKKIWYIQYYFYDPAFKHDKRYKYGKKCIIKNGINRIKTLKDRQENVRELLETEVRTLKEKGYNPITDRTLLPENISGDISPTTPFIEALYYALDKLKCTPENKISVRCSLNYFSKSAINLKYDCIPIKDITKKYIKSILDHCYKIKSYWSANQFNTYKKDISSLFTLLEEFEVASHNPTKGVKKQKVVKRIRKTLTEEERKKVNDFLRETRYPFWRFIHIFFHSGARIKELLSVKKEDVDLANQKYKCIILKGKEYKEELRTIKDVVLLLWQEVVSEANKNEYLFSVGLRPGISNIRREQATRRWRRHIKAKLNINADLYSLKHLNTDETTALLGLKDAAAHNSHTNIKTTETHYAVGEKERQHQRLKQVQNSFA